MRQLSFPTIGFALTSSLLGDCFDGLMWQEFGFATKRRSEV